MTNRRSDAAFARRPVGSSVRVKSRLALYKSSESADPFTRLFALFFTAFFTLFFTGLFTLFFTTFFAALFAPLFTPFFAVAIPAPRTSVCLVRPRARERDHRHSSEDDARRNDGSHRNRLVCECP